MFLLKLFGHDWIGKLVGLFVDNPKYVVEKDEKVILCGLHNFRTVINYSKKVGANGRVLGVEANPDNVERLHEKLKDLKNFKLINRAIWNKEDKISFIRANNEKYQGYNRVESQELQPFPEYMDKNPEKIEVRASTLDEIAKENNMEEVDHINLTINGAELQALDGIENLLKRNKNLRIFINSEYPEPFGKVVEKIKKMKLKFYTSLANSKIQMNKQIKIYRIYILNGR